jgi:hypothetical protein
MRDARRATLDNRRSTLDIQRAMRDGPTSNAGRAKIDAERARRKKKNYDARRSTLTHSTMTFDALDHDV